MEISEEDWFFESISRYKNLNMFELEQSVQHVEPVGNRSICVASSNSKRHQLLELSLPSKLLLQASKSSESVVTSDTDLKIKCGTFTEDMCFQMKAIDERKVLVSHVNSKGVALYNLSSDSDEIKKENFKIESNFECPMMATNNSLLWLTKKRADKILVYNMSTEKCIQSFLIDDKETPFECDERIVPMYLGPDMVAFGCQLTGEIYFCDNRMPLGWSLDSAYDGNCSNDRSLWSFSTLHECSERFTSTKQDIFYAKISKTGALVVYDTRHLKQPAYVDRNVGLKTSEDTPLQVRFKPGSNDWISFSGFDGNVYVYKMWRGEDPKLTFTHDGHTHVEGYSSQTVVTSHTWTQLDNLVISSADNGTIQMWQFENKETD